MLQTLLRSCSAFGNDHADLNVVTGSACVDYSLDSDIFQLPNVQMSEQGPGKTDVKFQIQNLKNESFFASLWKLSFNQLILFVRGVNDSEM